MIISILSLMKRAMHVKSTFLRGHHYTGDMYAVRRNVWSWYRSWCLKNYWKPLNRPTVQNCENCAFEPTVAQFCLYSQTDKLSYTVKPANHRSNEKLAELEKDCGIFRCTITLQRSWRGHFEFPLIQEDTRGFPSMKTLLQRRLNIFIQRLVVCLCSICQLLITGDYFLNRKWTHVSGYFFFYTKKESKNILKNLRSVICGSIGNASSPSEWNTHAMYYYNILEEIEKEIEICKKVSFWF